MARLWPYFNPCMLRIENPGKNLQLTRQGRVVFPLVFLPSVFPYLSFCWSNTYLQLSTLLLPRNNITNILRIRNTGKKGEKQTLHSCFQYDWVGKNNNVYLGLGHPILAHSTAGEEARIVFQQPPKYTRYRVINIPVLLSLESGSKIPRTRKSRHFRNKKWPE